MVDLDGSFNFSKIETIHLSGVFASVYPNPAQNLVNISSEERIRSVELISVSGQRLAKTLENGNSRSAVLSLQNISPGIYFVKTEGISGVSEISRIIVEK